MGRAGQFATAGGVGATSATPGWSSVGDRRIAPGLESIPWLFSFSRWLAPGFGAGTEDPRHQLHLAPVAPECSIMPILVE